MEWTLNPGDVIKRTDLHDRFGGSGQSGISPSRKSPNVFVFSEPKSGMLHGYYDHWEGTVFHYCGEGQKGDQEMVKGNRAILEHAQQGRELRVFEGASGDVTYLGRFTPDLEEPWYEELSHESGGSGQRKVIMFRLVPVGDFYHAGRRLRRRDTAPTLQQPYREADEEGEIKDVKVTMTDPDKVGRGRRSHATLQHSLAKHVRERGLEPLSPGFGDPPFDIGWWDGTTFVLVEVKSLTKENEVGQLRLGLGQVLDYGDQIKANGRQVRAVLAVEQEPSDKRWVHLCREHGVALLWPAAIGELFRENS